MEEHQNVSWGYPKGLYAKTVYYGIPIVKAAVVVGVVVFELQLRTRIFPDDWIWQFILFFLLSVILTVWLMLPSKAGGSNARAVMYFHRKRKHKYWSIERNAYPRYQTPEVNKSRFFGKGLK